MPLSSDAASSPASMHLLVVDDDEQITHLLHRYFSANGFRVSVAGSGAQMRKLIEREPVGLVMLDLGLPDEDGLSLTRYLRERWHGPVIIVSGRGESVDRVVGLELGADDYVTKPFDLRELLARVRSVLRRTRESAEPAATGTGPQRFHFAGFVLDTQAHSLHAPDASAVELTSGEFSLLRALVEQPSQVLSRDALMNKLHGRDANVYDRSIDMQIGRLRRKIETDASRPEIIKTVRGAGYLFAASVRQE